MDAKHVDQAFMVATVLQCIMLVEQQDTRLADTGVLIVQQTQVEAHSRVIDGKKLCPLVETGATDMKRARGG